MQTFSFSIVYSARKGLLKEVMVGKESSIVFESQDDGWDLLKLSFLSFTTNLGKMVVLKF